MKIFAPILIVLLGLFLSASAFADENPKLLPRCGQTDFGLCGFIDAKIWRDEGRTVFVIEPKYENARKFSDGLAAVRIDGTYGYIDASDNIVITPQFERVSLFDQGLAVAGKNGAKGIIDKRGKYVVDPIFSDALVFSDEIILGVSIENAAQGNIGFGEYGIDGAGLYSLADGWITDQTYNFSRFSDPEDGLIWAQVPMGKRGTWDDEYGLMRMDGSWLIEPQYSYAQELKSNRAPVGKRIDDQGGTGAIDKDGREVIPLVFDYLTHWDANFLQAGKGQYPERKVGLVTFDGDLLADRYFDEIQRPDGVFGPDHPSQEYYTVKDGGEWKTLTKDGALLSDQRVGQTFLACEQFTILYDLQGYALVPKDDSLPKIIFEKPLSSSSGQNCSPPPTLVQGDSYATVLENGKVFGGFFENGMGYFGSHKWVRVDGKWGLVDADGDFSVEPIYTSVTYEGGIRGRIKLPEKQTDETYKVIKNDEAYRLSFVGGKYEEKPFAELPEDVSKVLKCKGNYQRKSQNGLWGIVDEEGEDLIPAQYRAITCFSSGVAYVPDDTKQQWCPIDRDNRIRSAPACVTTQYSRWMSHHDPEKFDDDPYESSVLWMRAMLDYGEGRRENEPKLVPWDKY